MFNYYRYKMYNVYTIINPDKPTEAVISYWRFNVQGGLLFTPSDVLSGGITIAPGFKAYPESDLPEISSNIKSVSKFPLKIGAGINYMPLKNKLNLLFDYNFAQTSDLEGYKDRHNFNFGAELKVNPKLTLRAGAFTFFDIRDFKSQTVTFPQPEGEHEQIFITFGGTVNLKIVEITGSVMDSHISKGFVKNTYFNLGAAVNF